MDNTLPTMDFVVGANPLGSNSDVGQATKKVRTKSNLPPNTDDLTVDANRQYIQISSISKASYKSMLLGASSTPVQNVAMVEDFAFTDGDVVTEVVDGILSITFSNQVVWIRLSGLPKGYYSDCLLRAIGQMIGPVVKLDVHTVSARRGRFVWLAVCVDFRKPLVSKVKINGTMLHVEYESLQNVCFKCGCYGHEGRRGTLRDEDAGGGNVFLAILLQSSDITTIYVYSGSRIANFLSGIRPHSGVIVGWVLVALFGVIGWTEWCVRMEVGLFCSDMCIYACETFDMSVLIYAYKHVLM
ncbi:hypothetical protein Gotri_020854 [Gossypium trilobum]|uniref:Zinc knuckle CX2CX4HX4C domain-containing protein n=1 Tax=Gossypium trilobum TaxID=34281 RepID=A0A7J9DB10_9ROSI|nr:hypothetical protein [Gossypium trilobum]